MPRALANGVSRSAELLDRGPVPAYGRTLSQRARVRLRTAVLRALRPYSAYQHALDEAIVGGTLYQEERIERLEVFVDDFIATAEVLRRRIADLQQALASERALNRQLGAMPYMADDPFVHWSSPVGEVTGYRSRPAVIGNDSPYAGFEDLFRGPPERVTALQEPYLALVEDHQPVLDVGCGRGEFLALLRSKGIRGSGVDRDSGMIERCRAAGLPVTQAEAESHLEGLEDGSLGTVFSAQVIQHLSAAELCRFLQLARRKLKPGGLLIAETVNPHSVAALKTFWVDPTHRQPIFPETALALCALAGFASAYVFAPGRPSFEEAKLEATAYAVVATPAAPGE